MTTETAQPIERVEATDRTTLPSRFGRYLLVEHLATGGMADLYRAVAPGAAGVSKSICIKRILDARLEDPRLVGLFIDEARISMQLSHPNIVHTYDFGRVGDEYYLALELVEGVDLGALIDAGTSRGEVLNPEEVAAIGESLCRALAHVHSRVRPDGSALGLVHRDVTPRNVLLTREGDVKLADFGVARLRTNAREGLRGTIAYMSPEQANRGAVDARTDVFGVGLVLFECLRGKTAYTGERDDLLEQAKRGFVELGRTGDEPPLAASLLDVIERATARYPDNRYPDAAAMAEDLGRIVAQARAGGTGDPRASLAQRVASTGRAPLPLYTSDVPDAVDARRSVSYAVDGEAPDFVARLAGTELSQAATHASVADAAPGRTPVRRARLVGLAAGAGIVIGAIMALLWPVGGGADGGKAPAPPRVRTAPDVPAPRRSAPRDPPPSRASSERDTEPTPPPAPVTEGHTGSESARPHASAVARAPATLDLNAVPWADVTIDGVARGTTPVRGLSLPAGRHHVRLANPPLGVDRTIVVTLRPGEDRRLVVNLRDDGTNVADPPGGSP